MTKKRDDQNTRIIFLENSKQYFLLFNGRTMAALVLTPICLIRIKHLDAAVSTTSTDHHIPADEELVYLLPLSDDAGISANMKTFYNDCIKQIIVDEHTS